MNANMTYGPVGRGHIILKKRHNKSEIWKED